MQTLGANSLKVAGWAVGVLRGGSSTCFQEEATAGAARQVWGCLSPGLGVIQGYDTDSTPCRHPAARILTYRSSTPGLAHRMFNGTSPMLLLVGTKLVWLVTTCLCGALVFCTFPRISAYHGTREQRHMCQNQLCQYRSYIHQGATCATQ